MEPWVKEAARGLENLLKAKELKLGLRKPAGFGMTTTVANILPDLPNGKKIGLLGDGVLLESDGTFPVGGKAAGKP